MYLRNKIIETLHNIKEALIPRKKKVIALSIS